MEKSSWLQKKGRDNLLGIYEHRWFHLKNNSIYYFQDATERNLKGNNNNNKIYLIKPMN